MSHDEPRSPVVGGDVAQLQERYLGVVRAAILNEHYLENEVRIEHLSRAIELGIPVDPNILRDPVRFAQEAYRRQLASRHAGRVDDRPHYPMTTIGRVGVDALQAALDGLRRGAVRGDLVEIGTDRGGAGVFMRAYLAAVDDRSTLVHVVDPFNAEPASLVDHGPDINTVRDAYARFDLLDEQVRFVQGPTVQGLEAIDGPISLVRLGKGARASLSAVLSAVYDRIAPGGAVLIEDLGEAAEREVAAFRHGRGEQGALVRHGWRSASWTKEGPIAADRSGRDDAREEIALSVVVVAYEMRRAVRRTLHSLTRAYQRGIEDLRYEVIVVENGSSPDGRLGRELVESFGPEFRYLDMGPNASTSPVPALNRGIAAGRGDAFALMIDGAHLLSPGVLQQGLRGLRDHAPAIAAIRHWYLGPGQQDTTVGLGYDEAYEDDLLGSIGWPDDGYALFDIAQFIGEKDWLDRLYESNCLFVPRSLLVRYGAFDEAFDMPGGGYANLDLFERLEAAPDVTTVSVIGEATFHQVHGGITTNVDDPEAAVRQLNQYEEHYLELRGRPFHVDGSRIALTGSLTAGANRSRARRAVPKHFFRRRAEDADGFPTLPSIVPDDLRRDMTEAYWRSLSWRDVTWLGASIERSPDDLLAYQELLVRTRPDWVIQTSTVDDGLSYFLATMCDLIGHGQVISVRHAVPGSSADPEPHPRLAVLTGRPEQPAVVEALEARLGPSPNASVILGGRLARKGLLLAFTALEPFVPVGSYVVVENTIVNGHPVWRNYGPGPAEAVSQILGEGRFVRDRSLERQPLSFNPGGFLRRTV